MWTTVTWGTGTRRTGVDEHDGNYHAEKYCNGPYTAIDHLAADKKVNYWETRKTQIEKKQIYTDPYISNRSNYPILTKRERSAVCLT